MASADTDSNERKADPGLYQRPVHRTVTPANSNDNSNTLQSTLPPHLVGTAGISEGDQLTMLVCERGVFIPYEQ